jgi:hypothetical protein
MGEELLKYNKSFLQSRTEGRLFRVADGRGVEMGGGVAGIEM